MELINDNITGVDNLNASSVHTGELFADFITVGGRYLDVTSSEVNLETELKELKEEIKNLNLTNDHLLLLDASRKTEIDTISRVLNELQIFIKA